MIAVHDLFDFQLQKKNTEEPVFGLVSYPELFHFLAMATFGTYLPDCQCSIRDVSLRILLILCRKRCLNYGSYTENAKQIACEMGGGGGGGGGLPHCNETVLKWTGQIGLLYKAAYRTVRLYFKYVLNKFQF